MSQVPISAIHPSAPDSLSAVALFSGPVDLKEVLSRVELSGEPIEVSTDVVEGREIFRSQVGELTALVSLSEGKAPIDGPLPPHTHHAVLTILSPLARAGIELVDNLPDNVTSKLRSTMIAMHEFYTPLIRSLMAEENAVGVARPELNAVFPALTIISHRYVPGEHPFMLWIRVAIDHGTGSGRTYGLPLFGHLNLEIEGSSLSDEEVYSLLANAAGYIIEDGANLLPSQTLGLSENHKISIIQGESNGEQVLRLLA